MARAQIHEFFHRFKFLAFLPEKEDAVGLSECYQDPFAGTLILTRGHAVGETVLASRIGSSRKCTIYLLGQNAVRPFDITFDDVFAQFPALDASKDGVALDVVELINPKVVHAGDIKPAELPFAVRRFMHLS